MQQQHHEGVFIFRPLVTVLILRPCQSREPNMQTCRGCQFQEPSLDVIHDLTTLLVTWPQPYGTGIRLVHLDHYA